MSVIEALARAAEARSEAQAVWDKLTDAQRYTLANTYGGTRSTARALAHRGLGIFSSFDTPHFMPNEWGRFVRATARDSAEKVLDKTRRSDAVCKCGAFASEHRNRFGECEKTGCRRYTWVPSRAKRGAQ